MKQTIAGTILLIVWVAVLLWWGSSGSIQTNADNENPCDFMNSGQYSVNC